MSDCKKKSWSKGDYFSNDNLRAGLKERALRGAGATVFSHFSMFAIQLIGTIILARLLTPDDFGLVAMVATFSILLQNFGVRGFTEATIQSDAINHRKISTVFWIHVALSILLTLLFVALSPLIAWFYKEPRLEAIAIVIAATPTAA